MSELDEIEAFVDRTINEFKEKYYNDSTTIKDKIDHITRVTDIASKKWPNDQLVRIAAKIHDIGRFDQYEVLGKFDDGKILHHYLGENFITRAVYQGEIKDSEELDMLRAVVKYHGRDRFIPFKNEIPEQAKNLIDIIGRVDGIENGCIGAVGYLVREKEEDAKSYRANNPELDMKSISPEVMSFFEKGEKFDKMKYCKTYADYTLFAVVLAITALKGKDRELALDAMKNYTCSRAVKLPDGSTEIKEYENAIEGYNDVFSELLYPEDKEKCMEILEGFYNNPSYRYVSEEYNFGTHEQNGLEENDDWLL